MLGDAVVAEEPVAAGGEAVGAEGVVAAAACALDPATPAPVDGEETSTGVEAAEGAPAPAASLAQVAKPIFLRPPLASSGLAQRIPSSPHPRCPSQSSTSPAVCRSDPTDRPGSNLLVKFACLQPNPAGPRRDDRWNRRR